MVGVRREQPDGPGQRFIRLRYSNYSSISNQRETECSCEDWIHGPFKGSFFRECRGKCCQLVVKLVDDRMSGASHVVTHHACWAPQPPQILRPVTAQCLLFSWVRDGFKGGFGQGHCARDLQRPDLHLRAQWKVTRPVNMNTNEAHLPLGTCSCVATFQYPFL